MTCLCCPYVDGRGAVTLECARLLQPTPDHPVELFQIIGQDSYEGAVRKSNGAVLMKLHQPPRCLIVTPREGLDRQVASSSADIVVPPQHGRHVCVLTGYRDEMVQSPRVPPQLHGRTRSFLTPTPPCRCCPPQSCATCSRR